MNRNMYRGTQIDLARQIEPLPVIFRFFDTALEAGMNMVFLYLEDRIKTPSYPYSSDEESYSVAQVTEMVKYAGNLGIELVPVVSCLGHVERFLRHPELAHLAELRGNIAGGSDSPGHSSYHVACPRLPEAIDFFDRYIAEVAALFPSVYFHAGYDETFDLGYCELCLPVFEKDGLPALILESICHTHALLSGLGKRMMIWDDMFEDHREALEKLPRDIILCAWYYNFIDRRPEGRFNNSLRQDSLVDYKRLGFKCFICSYFNMVNLESLTEYALPREPDGMLMTVWSLREKQLVFVHPFLLYAGSLWGSAEYKTPTQRMTEVCECLTGSRMLAEIMAVTLTQYLNPVYWLPGKETGLLECIELPDDGTLRQEAVFEMLKKGLESFESENGSAGDYAEAVLTWVHPFLLMYKINAAAYRLLKYKTGELAAEPLQLADEFDCCRQEAQNLFDRLKASWQKFRPGISSTAMDQKFDGIFAELDALNAAAKTVCPGEYGRLDIRFCLPDQTVAPRTRITVSFEDGSEWEIPSTIYKSADKRKTWFSYTFAFPAGNAPESVLLSVSGYGGTGIAYADITTKQGRFVPGSVLGQSGQVQNAGNILRDDTRFAWIGEPDVQRVFNCPGSSETKHTLKISMNLFV